jgi:hypothetical protein
VGRVLVRVLPWPQTHKALVEQRVFPATMAQLQALDVDGLGDLKYAQYGPLILQVGVWGGSRVACAPHTHLPCPACLPAS